MYFWLANSIQKLRDKIIEGNILMEFLFAQNALNHKFYFVNSRNWGLG